MVDTLHVPPSLDEDQLRAHSSRRRLVAEPCSSSAAAAAVKQARRQSLRPPLPPKPPAMVRSLSEEQQRPSGVAQRTSSLAPPSSSTGSIINPRAYTTGGAATGAVAGPSRLHGDISEEPVGAEATQRWPQQLPPDRPASRQNPSTTTSGSTTSPAPALPPRPLAQSTPIYPTESADTASPSSCPPILSPFATAADNESDTVAPLMRPSASRSPERSRFRTLGGTGTNGQAASGGLSTSASYSSLNPSSALSALGRGWQQAKFKDRLGAGVGYAKEWGGKGKGKLQDQWRGFGGGVGGGGTGAAGGPNSHRATASVSTHGVDPSTSSGASSSSATSSNGFSFSNSSRTLSAFLSPSTTMPDLASSAGGSQPPAHRLGLGPTRGAGVRFPAVLYSVSVPDRHGLVFGRPLASVVESTRTPSLPRPSSKDEVTGDEARYWLPGIAYRCLEYLEEWGMREEGVFRVPGRSSHTAELKAMFDAGVGQERDLREVHPSELDPHAVASVFKSWLRDLPDPLLSHEIESLVDELTIQSLGYGASSNNFLASKGAAAASGTPSPASSAPASPNVSQGYIEQLRDLMATRMPAEHWTLIRAVVFHLARLADNAHVNKMTLNNLRLILSPTLRLSPGFLQILVVERQALFSRPNEAAMRRFGQTDSHSPSLPLPARRQAQTTPTPSERQLEPPRIDSRLANETAQSRLPVLPSEAAPPSPSAILPSSPTRTPRNNRFLSQVQEASPVSAAASNDSTPILGGSSRDGDSLDSEPVESLSRISPEPPQLERLSLGEEFRDAIEQFDRAVGGKVPSADFDFDTDQEQEQERLADRTPSRPKQHRKGHSNLSISSMRSFMSSTSLSSTASSNGTSSESDLRSARVRHAHTASASSNSFWRRKQPPSSVSAADMAKRRQSVALNFTLPIGLGVNLPGDNSNATSSLGSVDSAGSTDSIAQSGLLSVEERRRLFGG
ncbi:hypothetical protein JCM10908_004894 [Rhodotorula pacifica]|uniref:uncharacterized protein n=1 Tax=Rhodotorula pacifica TaxID=1495444 RepID=UPI0031746AF9